MIKVKYLGYECDDLESGRVYKISTTCSGSSLVVKCRSVRIKYHNLEQFLKDWRVVAVYGK